jgi:putative FmdB family regulatory protein
MPIYEYQCTSCEEKYEMRRSISDNDDDIKCPKCGAERPRRVLSQFTSAKPSADACAPTGGG